MNTLPNALELFESSLKESLYLCFCLFVVFLWFFFFCLVLFLFLLSVLFFILRIEKRKNGI